MRILIFTLIFTCFLTSVFGQLNLRTNLHKDHKSVTYFNYNLYQSIVDTLNLTHIISDTNSMHFRFWTNGQAIDVWSNDNKMFYGKLTNYIYQFLPKKDPNDIQETERTKILSHQIQLDTSLARQTFNHIQSISFIPSEDSIKGWGRGHDGIGYCFELLNSDYYYFKSYWEPNAQDSTLIAAKHIQAFVDNIYSLLDLEAEYEKFFETLKPNYYYTRDGHENMFKPTNEQEKSLKKYLEKDRPNREYLESIRDTLNHYLGDTLTKLLINNGFNCYNDFFLKFSSNNRLIKIETNQKFIDSEDKKKYLKCKKKIRKAFRHVRLDFVKCKRKYSKKLVFYDNKIIIY